MTGAVGKVKKVSEVLLKDILSYRKVLEEREKIFLDRRELYGDHLDNAVRFPLESLCGLYLKMCRQMRDIEKYIPVDILLKLNKDTLQDLANYDDLILSVRGDKK